MKYINKVSLIIISIIAISIIFSNNVLAVGNAFSQADNFLNKRKLNIFCNR